MFPIDSLEVLTTTGSNLNCSYCFEHTKNNRFDTDWELLDEKYFSKGYVNNVDFFGGEPLLRLDTIEKHIKKYPFDDRTKQVITNGLLVPKYIEKIKELGINLQISLDGCKEANDLNRGKGTYDAVMKAIEAAVEHEVPWSVHGVLSKNAFKYFTESMKEYYRLFEKYGRINPETGDFEAMSGNLVIMVFEEDFTDDDIDILLAQFDETVKWVTSLDLPESSKTALLRALLYKSRGGSICGAGTNFFIVDHNYNIFSCHRAMTTYEDKKITLGNLLGDELTNFAYFNTFNWMKTKGNIYSLDNLDPLKENNWGYYCPASNSQTSDYSLDYQNAKYGVLIREMGRWLDWAENHYDVLKEKHRKNEEKKVWQFPTIQQ
jgi:sulfatase maturation enzyme AslB (radical SAM superfamily)